MALRPLPNYRPIGQLRENMTYKTLLTGFGTTALALALAACSAPAAEQATQPVYSSATEYVADNAVTIASGTFDGRSDHITTGGVTIEKTGGGYQLRFAADFSLDGAPDPVVALGNGETFLVANKLGPLKNKTGAQTYQLPAGFTPGQFSEVYVWCEKFSVPLGVASLTAT